MGSAQSPNLTIVHQFASFRYYCLVAIQEIYKRLNRLDRELDFLHLNNQGGAKISQYHNKSRHPEDGSYIGGHRMWQYGWGNPNGRPRLLCQDSRSRRRASDSTLHCDSEQRRISEKSKESVFEVLRSS